MALEDELRAVIQNTGPISIARYMAEALGHPKYGYYINKDPLGAKGDFTTAPEISQMFGEMLGLWLIDCWQKLGAPTSVHLIELGPGRGTLMSDMLRALKLAPPLLNGLSVHFVETSPALRKAQREKIPQAQWHDRIDGVGEGFSFIIANEFFDALPIRQLVKTGKGWHERFVHWDENAQKLAPFSSPSSPDLSTLVPASLRDAPTGSTFEFSPASQAIAQTIAERIKTHGGAACFIDYGHMSQGIGDTLQAVRNHQYTDIFADPGQADLTAHVDFAALAHIAREAGCQSCGPTTQGAFLKALGIETRAAQLSKSATEEQAENLKTGLHRLISAEEMGELFKVLAIGPKDSPPLAGF